MVTDKERDYLWETYASDRRARINLGIRRRLAPLLERDRRRIELMNFLLLTMPGTPVLYYGDEIGMGDNTHLGDRDGVRTPMQWSSDRNGGFSRADPASLVLPPVQDPLYGYQAVNVEAQWRDPHSLLNWMRRMLSVRGQHQAFGRGTQRFLRPMNRKMLAYLREYQGESILCVANLSRSAQAVELDLSEFAGRVPVELSGGTAFPKIGQLTYLLTLPPFGFVWFLLSAEAEAPAWSSATAGPLAEHYTFVLRTGLQDIVAGSARKVLQHDILPFYIAQRRWFQNKDEGVHGVEINAFDALPGAGPDAIFVELCVEVNERIERYTLPMTVAWEDAPSYPFEAPLALARVRRGRRVGLLTDAFATPVLPRAMILGLQAKAVVPLQSGGRLVCRPTSAMASVSIAEDAEIHWPGAEQTNSTLVVGQSGGDKTVPPPDRRHSSRVGNDSRADRARLFRRACLARRYRARRLGWAALHARGGASVCRESGRRMGLEPDSAVPHRRGGGNSIRQRRRLGFRPLRNVRPHSGPASRRNARRAGAGQRQPGVRAGAGGGARYTGLARTCLC